MKNRNVKNERKLYFQSKERKVILIKVNYKAGQKANNSAEPNARPFLVRNVILDFNYNVRNTGQSRSVNSLRLFLLRLRNEKTASEMFS